jgi:hypothetical protein
MQQPEWRELKRVPSPEQTQSFIDGLTVASPKATQVIVVTFTDRQPDVARRAVSAVLNAYQQMYVVKENEGVETRQKILDSRRSALLLEQKGLTEQIMKKAGAVPARSINALYDAKLDQLIKLEWQLREAELAAAKAGAGTNRKGGRRRGGNDQARSGAPRDGRGLSGQGP